MKKAFTLIELIVIIVIIGVLTLAIAMIINWGRTRAVRANIDAGQISNISHQSKGGL